MIDTDVVVDVLRGQRELEPIDERPAVSVVTRCELFAGVAEEEARVRVLLSSMWELAVDTWIAERAGQIRRETRLATPDALIAATALEHGRALMTRNRRHFKRVDGLQLIEP